MDYVDEMIIGEKSWRQVISSPLQRIPFIHVKAKHALQSATKSVKTAFSTFGASAGSWSRRFGAVLLLELALVLFLHFYMLVPVMFVVIPVVALDYIGFVGVILYLKIMVSLK